MLPTHPLDSREWEAKRVGSVNGCPGDTWIVCVKDTNWLITEVTGTTDTERHARLIAAAPEMRELLDTLDAMSESFDQRTRNGRDYGATKLMELGGKARGLLARIDGSAQ